MAWCPAKQWQIIGLRWQNGAGGEGLSDDA
jgi:hypothetical protein